MYFVSLVILGSFFVLNLVLGVLSGYCTLFKNVLCVLYDSSILFIQRVFERERKSKCSGTVSKIQRETTVRRRFKRIFRLDNSSRYDESTFNIRETLFLYESTVKLFAEDIEPVNEEEEELALERLEGKLIE